MDDNTSYFQPKRLTKRSPSTSVITSRMSQDSTGPSAASTAITQLLRRHPSAPDSPVSSGTTTNSRETGSDHHRTPSSVSSNSPSPNLSVSKYSSQPPQEGYPNRYRYSANQSLNEKSSDEMIRTPSDTSDVVSPLDSTKASGYQTSLRRPDPNILSRTTSNTTMMSPSLRESASFSVGDRSNAPVSPQPDSGSTTPKRYSDEAKNSAPWKKKSGFSSFMNSVLGSPRNMKISAPGNPVHVTHVGYDMETGQFTVRIQCLTPASQSHPIAAVQLNLPVLSKRELSVILKWNLTLRRAFLQNGRECCAPMELPQVIKSEILKQLWTS